jgi:RNA polymerase sigma factor (sigma-70 family)
MRQYNKIQPAGLPDTVLVERVAQGDQEAFEILVQRYTPPLFNFIRRYVKDYEQSNDILQHVFFQFYLHITQLNNNLSTLHTQEPIKAWLYQVAWNRCMDELRKKKPILFSDLALGDEEEEWSFLETIPDPYPLPEEVAEQSDIQKRLQQAIADPSIEISPYRHLALPRRVNLCGDRADAQHSTKYGEDLLPARTPAAAQRSDWAETTNPYFLTGMHLDVHARFFTCYGFTPRSLRMNRPIS